MNSFLMTQKNFSTWFIELIRLFPAVKKELENTVKYYQEIIMIATNLHRSHYR